MMNRATAYFITEEEAREGFLTGYWQAAGEDGWAMFLGSTVDTAALPFDLGYPDIRWEGWVCHPEDVTLVTKDINDAQRRLGIVTRVHLRPGAIRVLMEKW